MLSYNKKSKMNLLILLGYILITTRSFAFAQVVCNDNDIFIKCPEWNFHHHQENQNIYPQYTLEIVHIQHNNHDDSETYDVTIRVHANEHIELKHLHSLKIIGIQGPQGDSSIMGQK